jgi:hypothetical protein
MILQTKLKVPSKGKNPLEDLITKLTKMDFYKRQFESLIKSVEELHPTLVTRKTQIKFLPAEYDINKKHIFIKLLDYNYYFQNNEQSSYLNLFSANFII